MGRCGHRSHIHFPYVRGGQSPAGSVSRRGRLHPHLWRRRLTRCPVGVGVLLCPGLSLRRGIHPGLHQPVRLQVPLSDSPMTVRSKSPVSSGLRNIAILVAVVGVLYMARELLIPLAFAVTLSLILVPPIAWLQKLRMGRIPAALVVMVVAIAGTAAIGWMIFNDLVAVANQLPEYQANIHKKLEAIRAPNTGAVGRAAASVKELGKELANAPSPVATPPAADRAGRRAAPIAPSRPPLPVQVVEAPAHELLYVRDMTQPFLRPLGVFLMVLIFSLFLTIGHEDLRDRLFRVVGVSQLNTKEPVPQV